MNPILSITNLTKSFGEKKVLDGLSMEIPKGCIYGFIGKNGAGKTTTMKLILGLLKADAGEIRVCNEIVRFGRNDVNRHIGYLPDVPSFYNYMTALEYLQLCAELLNIEKTRIKKRVEELLEAVGLKADKKRMGGFSRGMKQRLGIAQALIGQPDLLICDEPTSALDPIGRRDILNILSSISSKTTVIFSTHVLSDVEEICDRVGILSGGRVVLHGQLSELKASYSGDKIVIELMNQEDCSKMLKILQDSGEGSRLCQEGNSITYKIRNRESDAKKLLYMMAEESITPLKFSFEETSLEDIFVEVTK
jgi:ABC-2 type transport system ATP-binding protein